MFISANELTSPMCWSPLDKFVMLPDSDRFLKAHRAALIGSQKVIIIHWLPIGRLSSMAYWLKEPFQ